ncbi:Rac GTPase-activating protein 1 [Armadillidium nasatum]|uniref:Rac GTPase-activating protein 1 n=1 Tax=Armadillidium nasatum TaxID=96803 RepID=A0A5N5SK13_9CRUS|nr:Rac GTPase-activating protein 1 [Armadillidium nasatum]
MKTLNCGNNELGVSEKKIYTREKCYKCQTCNSVCHEDCSDALPIPCVPMVIFSEKLKIKTTTIADHTPRTSPMVPALIVYCSIEIENRGLDSKGIYRTSGAQKDVLRLKNHFLKGEGVPNLKKEDINVLCSTIKIFLHSLKEPLITLGVRKDFENAIDKPEINVKFIYTQEHTQYNNELSFQEMCPALMQCVSEMPQPNRDTLAWMMRHLKRVCEVEENKMNVDNICTVFAPTLIDHYLNVKETGNLRIKEENNRGIKLVKALMSLEYDYWGSLLQGKESPPLTVSSPLSLNFSRTSWKRRSIILFGERISIFCFPIIILVFEDSKGERYINRNAVMKKGGDYVNSRALRKKEGNYINENVSRKKVKKYIKRNLTGKGENHINRNFLNREGKGEKNINRNALREERGIYININFVNKEKRERTTFNRNALQKGKNH